MAILIKNPKSRDLQIFKLGEILSSIKEGDWAVPVNEVRIMKAKGAEDEANRIKSNLPCFTISAEYTDSRKVENLTRYLGYVHLDYDKLDDPSKVKSKVELVPYTYSAFISPSGNGLKVIVPVDSGEDDHLNAFNAVKEYYDSVVGVTSDPTVKDILRLCFVSYDPDLYLNTEANTFILPKDLGGDAIPDLGWISSFTNAKVRFEEGSRNQFVYQLACNANRYGIDKQDVMDYCSSLIRPGFEWDEIESTVAGAFQRNASEFYTKTLTSFSSFSSLTTTTWEFETPYIPESVYELLPDILRDACKLFSARERDVFLISCLSTFSGALRLEGKYAKDKLCPNLYTLVVANAASGKGVMKYARTLVYPFHEAIRKESEAAYKKWIKAINANKGSKKGASKGDFEHTPKPLQKTFLIPGDVTTSKLMEHLEASKGYGCIFETESDSIGKNLRKEHSNYSDILRKAYHNEPISLSRMDGARFAEVHEPRFSATISGTPGQFNGIVKSLEDGLVSRLLVYYYKRQAVWNQTYFEDEDNKMLDELHQLSIKVTSVLENQMERTVHLTPEQGKRRDDWFSVIYPEMVALHGDQIAGVVTRLGVASQKIAMVLTAFRNDQDVDVIDDRDFEIGLTLVREVFLPHAIAFLTPLLKASKGNNNFGMLDRFYERLPDEFTKDSLDHIQSELHISNRRVGELLKELINSERLERIKRGLYRKR